MYIRTLSALPFALACVGILSPIFAHAYDSPHVAAGPLVVRSSTDARCGPGLGKCTGGNCCSSAGIFHRLPLRFG